MTSIDLRRAEERSRKERSASASAARQATLLSLRAKIILALVGLGLAIWAMMASALVLNARIAVEREITFTFDIASRFLEARKREAELATFPSDQLNRLASVAGSMRHVRITVIDPNGRVLPAPARMTASDLGDDEGGTPPDWFVSLTDVEPLRLDLPVVLSNGQTFLLVLESHSFDEILEVWDDFRLVMPITMAYTAVLIAASILLLNVILGRLKLLSNGLVQLQDGKGDVRLPDPGIPEFRPLVEHFNQLACALAAREDENRQLTRRLLWIQDAERHRIAHELHDELGPYLFGLRVTIDSLGRCTAADNGSQETMPAKALSSLSDSVQAIQTRTRRIISDLRPMSLGEVPVTDLIEDGIADVRRLAGDAGIRLLPNTCSRSFGEAIDLTVYRFVQESVLNALRHGEAGKITVGIGEEWDSAMTGSLVVHVCDDGKGPASCEVKPGYGLVGVAERVAALGGHWSAPHRDGEVTRTTIRLPIGPQHRVSEAGCSPEATQ